MSAPAGRGESFSIDRRGSIVRSVSPKRGQPYQHRCQRSVFETVAHAIDERVLDGFVLEEIVEAEDLPSSQVATAIAFLRELGCVRTECRRAYPTTVCVHLDAMIEYHAMRDEPELASKERGNDG